MDPLLILASIDAASNLIVKLIAAYNAMPDADPAIKDALAAQVAELDKTAALVAAWKPVAAPDADSQAGGPGS